MSLKPKVTIVYLVWSDEPWKYLDMALTGVGAQTYSREDLRLLIVYNFHKPNEKSAIDFIRQSVADRTGDLPETIILEQEKNLGFSGGNNLGMKWAVENNCQYVFLHNADGYLHPGAIENMVAAMAGDEKIGQLQPLILLHPEKNLINSSGNALHYLFIGYTRDFRKDQSVIDQSKVKEVGYVSGAATMIRTDLINKYGVWSHEFFMYHEDTEYSLRLRLLGYKLAIAPAAIFYHQYEFTKSTAKYYWIERNRHALQLIFLKWPTFFLLLPMEIIYNFGLIILSLFQGWLNELIKVYWYWLQPKNWRIWLVKRSGLQKMRTISDRELMSHMVARVDAERLGAKHFSAFANAIFTFYFKLLRILVKW